MAATLPAEGKLLVLAQQQLEIERQLRAMVEEEAANAHERFEHEQVYQKHVQDEVRAMRDGGRRCRSACCAAQSVVVVVQQQQPRAIGQPPLSGSTTPIHKNAQKLMSLEKDLCQSHLENHQLRLEVHRWRKQHALVKLRLAGAQEDFDLQASHARQLEARCETLEAQRAALSAQIDGLKAHLQQVQGQVSELSALKSGTEEEAAKLKEDLGSASEDQCRLTEQVRLATMRATAASESARAMEEALAGARREADAAREQVRFCFWAVVRAVFLVALMQGGRGCIKGASSAVHALIPWPPTPRLVQLAAVRRREADSSASQTQLHMALESTKNELAR